MTEAKRTALDKAKARYPNNERKRHYEFIRLWETECKREVTRLLAQPSDKRLETVNF